MEADHMSNVLLKNMIERAIEQLRSHDLAEGTVRMYMSRSFKPVEDFFQSRNCPHYKDTLIDELKSIHLSQLNEGKISKGTYNWRIRGVKILEEVSATGHFEWKVFYQTKKVVIPNYFEPILNQFMDTLNHLSPKSKGIYESILRRFFTFLSERKMNDLSQVNGEDIHKFIILISNDRPKSMDDVITALRRLFTFYETQQDISNIKHLLFGSSQRRKHKVLDCVTMDEISTILSSIDRTTPLGKRNHALLLLASTTGLRAGDIADLKLTDIDWKNSKISFLQGKTKKTLHLPLSKIAGDALADYILNARPNSNSQAVFLRSIAPFNGFKDGTSVACIFRRYLKKVGINHSIGDGKTFHGIRRMLATEMLRTKTPVTTIAQVLGHQHMNVTKQYISLDIEGLSHCTLGFKSLSTRRNSCESV